LTVYAILPSRFFLRLKQVAAIRITLCAAAFPKTLILFTRNDGQDAELFVNAVREKLGLVIDTAYSDG
jgi:hypothetical protein